MSQYDYKSTKKEYYLIHNLVPVIVSFKEDLTLDLESCKSHALFLKRAGIKSVVIGGTTGEGFALTGEEKEKLCDLFLELDFTVVGCISSFDWLSTLNSIYAFRSAHYLLVMPPMFIRPSEEDIVHFFEFVKNKSDKQIILYNNPARTNVDISKMYHKFDYVLGVKETNFTHIPKIAWWCGEDSFAIQAMELGASGLISASANVFPSISEKIALKIQTKSEKEKWLKYANLVFKFSNPLVVKYLLKKRGIIASDRTRFAIKLPECRLKLDLTEQEKAVIWDELIGTEKSDSKLKELEIKIGKTNLYRFLIEEIELDDIK